MRIYIAAPYQMRADAIDVMTHLEARGHHVTSRWLKDVEDPNDLTQQQAYAEKCAVDIYDAELVLLLNSVEWRNSGTGGRHVEVGLALALGRRIVILGVRTNVFHHLDCVKVIERIEDLL